MLGPEEEQFSISFGDLEWRERESRAEEVMGYGGMGLVPTKPAGANHNRVMIWENEILLRPLKIVY